LVRARAEHAPDVRFKTGFCGLGGGAKAQHVPQRTTRGEREAEAEASEEKSCRRYAHRGTGAGWAAA
jgi:hypothetical protein